MSAAEVYVSSKLKTHTIYYYDGADSARAEIPNVKYTTPLNGSVTGVEYNAKPTPECVAHHPGMKFAGWYKDPALSEKFDFANATMPNADLALYAKFEPVQFDLSFDVNGGNDGEEFADQRVDYGTKIGELPVPVKPGYEFGGWKLDGKPVSPQATITDDTKLVATWIPKGVIKIKYVDQNGKEIPGLDGASYSADALAKVKAPGDKVVPTGDEKFLYWKADDGRAYYPGTSVAASIAKADSETDTAWITMTAVCGAENSKAQLVYHANNGGDASLNETVVNNDYATIKAVESLFEAPSGYEFGWWSGDPVSAVSETYQAGAKVYVNAQPADATNDVYARWIKLDADSKGKDYDGDALVLDAAAVKLHVVGGDDIDVSSLFNITYKWTDENGVSHEGADLPSRTNKGVTNVTVVAQHKLFGDIKIEKNVTLTVKGIALSIGISGNSKTVDYNGGEQSVEGFTYTTLPEGLSLALKSGNEAVAKGTDAGTYNMGLTADMFELVGDAAKNYEPTITVKQDGGLTINPVDLTIKIAGNTKTVKYNGEKQAVAGFAVTNISEIPSDVRIAYVGTPLIGEGDDAMAVFGASASGVNVRTYYMGLSADSFKAAGKTAKNYNVKFDVTDGWLKIEPKSITPTDPTDPENHVLSISQPDDVVYNASAQEQPLTVKDGDKVLVEGTDYELSYSPAINVGTVKVTVTGINNYEGADSVFYRIIERPVVISAAQGDNTNSKLYGDDDPDFTPAQMTIEDVENYPEASAEQIEAMEKELAAINLDVVRAGAGTDEGVGEKISVLNITATAEELHGSYPNYTFSVQPGDFEIKTNSEDAVISLDTGKWTYDATDHGNTAKVLVGGEESTDYDIEYQWATVSVAEDGVEVVGEWSEPSADAPEIKNVGKIAVRAQATRTSYEPVEMPEGEYATFEIKRRPVTVAAAPSGKQFGDADPEPFADASMAVQPVEGDIDEASAAELAKEIKGAQLTVSRDIASDEAPEAVGTHEGVLAPASTKAQLDQDNPNFEFAVAPADFVISKKVVDPTPDPTDPEDPEKATHVLTVEGLDDVYYNGGSQKQADKLVVKIDGKELSAADLAANFDLIWADPATGEDDAVNAGTVEVTVRAKEDGNYEGADSVAYEIKRRPVTVAAAPSGKQFGDADPEPFADASMAVQPVEGDIDEASAAELAKEIKGAQLTVSRDIASDEAPEAVGTHEGVLAPASTKAQLDQDNPNFEFAVAPADFVISKKVVDPTPDPTDPEDPEKATHVLTVEGLDDVYYNGGSQKQADKLVVKIDGKELSAADLAANFDLIWADPATGEDDAVNAGTVEVTVRAKEDGNYEGADSVAYEIKRRPVVIDAAQAAEKSFKHFNSTDPVFDAAVLVVEDVDAAALLTEEQRAALVRELGEIDLTVNRSSAGTDETVGTYPDALTITDSADTLNKEYGNFTFTVRAANFDIINATDNVVTDVNIAGMEGTTKVYDGQAIAAQPEASVEGSTFQYSADGEIWSDELPEMRNVGTYDVWVRALADGYDPSPAYRATFSVTRAPLTVSTEGAIRAYDGEALTNAAATLTGLVAGETATVRATGAQTAVGSSENGYEIIWGTADRDNYEIIEDLGVLTVTAALVPNPDDPTPLPTPTPTPIPTPVVIPTAVTPAPTPAAPAAPAAPAPAAPAPAATPAAATPAPAAEPIEDDATPQAAAPAERTPLAETEEIEDEGTPMGAFDEPHCWVHWVMLLGILITAAYGVIVVRRRLHLADDVDDYEKQVLGIEDEAPEAVPATGRQAL